LVKASQGGLNLLGRRRNVRWCEIFEEFFSLNDEELEPKGEEQTPNHHPKVGAFFFAFLGTPKKKWVFVSFRTQHVVYSFFGHLRGIQLTLRSFVVERIWFFGLVYFFFFPPLLILERLSFAPPLPPLSVNVAAQVPAAIVGPSPFSKMVPLFPGP